MSAQPYILIRSKRKTLSLTISNEARVQVRAPLKMPLECIDQFVDSKERWIKKHMCRMSERAAQKDAFELNYRDKVLLFGREYPIKEQPCREAFFDGDSIAVPPGLNSSEIKRSLVMMYKRTARVTLTKQALELAEILNVVPSSVRITGARTRWGSCSGKNRLCFSWYLVMAPPDAVDYVIVHELAHIREHNHSPRFWGIVQKALPDYEKRKAKLKDLGHRLSFQEWEKSPPRP